MEGKGAGKSQGLVHFKMHKPNARFLWSLYPHYIHIQRGDSRASVGRSVSCPVAVLCVASPRRVGVLILLVGYVLASSPIKRQGTREDNGYCPAAVGSLEGRGHME